MEESEIDKAFRRGINGRALAAPDPEPLGPNGSEAASPPSAAAGPNEALLLGLHRMPGLSDPRAAHETGRALRMIIRLFDQAGAPASVGQQFIDNLGAAVMGEQLRHRRAAWGAADTADMFIEMYARVLGGSRVEHDLIRRKVIDYAVLDAGAATGAGGNRLAGLFRRHRGRAAGVTGDGDRDGEGNGGGG